MNKSGVRLKSLQKRRALAWESPLAWSLKSKIGFAAALLALTACSGEEAPPAETPATSAEPVADFGPLVKKSPVPSVVPSSVPQEPPEEVVATTQPDPNPTEAPIKVTLERSQITVMPQTFSKAVAQLSCSYTELPQGLPSGARVEYAWKLDDQKLLEWGTDSRFVQGSLLKAGASLSCGVRVVQAAQNSQPAAVNSLSLTSEVLSEVWTLPKKVENALPPEPKKVELSLSGKQLRCVPEFEKLDADGQSVLPIFRWKNEGKIVVGAKTDVLSTAQIAKGAKIECEVATNDGLANSPFVTSNTIIRPNGVPFAPTKVEIAASASLKCLASGAIDPDQEPLVYNYTWKRNGVLVPESVLSEYTGPKLRNDKISCGARSSDGTDASLVVASAEVTILNSAPGIPASVVLSPTLASKSANLVCNATGSTDVDGDVISYFYSWYKNGVLVPGATFSTLASDTFAKADLIKCSAAGSDGLELSGVKESNLISILNSIPSIPTSVVLSPTELFANIQSSGAPTCAASGSSDLDAESLSYEYAFRKNGTLVQPFSTESRFVSGPLAKGDKLSCAARAVDGDLAQSASLWSAEATVQNSRPSVPASVSVFPAEVRVGSSVLCNASGAIDSDSDTLSYEIEWQKNGALLVGQNSLSLSVPLAKGDSLSCAARSSDGSLVSDWVKSSSVSVQNSAPVGPAEVTLSADSAGVDATLSCAPSAAGAATDVDGDVLSVEYSWKRNGSLVPDENSARLSASSFLKGDAITCRMRASDGELYSEWVESFALNMQNEIPSAVAGVSVSPGTLNATTTGVSCARGTASDADGDTLSYETAWKINGSVVQAFGSAAAYSGVSLVKGDVVSCGVRAKDSSNAFGPESWGTDVVVQNSAPTVASTVSLSPASVSVTSQVNCVASGATDADPADTVTSLYRWKKNGSVVSGQSAATYSASFVKNDTLQCEVQSSDGLLTSAWVASSVATVQNSAPTAPTAVSLSPSTAYKTTTLTCAATGSTDADGDTVSYIYFWKVNDTLVSGATGSTLNGSRFSKSDNVTCEVAASDQTLMSALVSSPSVAILNSVPGAVPVVELSPLPVVARSAQLECTAGSAFDADGEALNYEFSFQSGSTVLQPWGASPNYASAMFVKGTSLSCGVRAVDGDAAIGPELWTANTVVQNSAPNPYSSVSITPTNPVATQALNCNVSGSSDPDNDPVTTLYRWQKNGILISGQTLNTLAPANFGANDSIVCEAAASDSALTSSFVASSDVVINSGPLLTLTGTSPASPSTSRNLVVQGVVEASTLVRVYTNSTCTGTERVQVSASDFAATGAAIALTSSEVFFNFSARAFDGSGNFSACASGVSYFRQAEKIVDFSDSSASLALLASNPTAGAEIAGKIVFAATHPSTGTELWVSDGTAAGTVLLKDINQAGSSSPANFRLVGSRVFFSADNGTQGSELWATDGTPDGTYLVRDIRSGASASSPANLRNFNGILIFSANDGSAGAELWRSDGTSAGTVMIRDIYSGSTASNPSGFTTLGSFSYFAATDVTNGTELWRTDGTSAGTTLVANIRATNGSSSPAQLTAVNGYVVFVADDGVNGAELWSSDGVTTSMLRNINGTSAASTITGVTVHQNNVYFFANDGTTGAELWKSNGTAAGTTLVSDIRSGTSGSQPTTVAMASFGSWLMLSATNSTNGTELFRSDGTAAGTTLVRDITSGSSSSSPQNFLVVGSRMYFQAAGELYTTDATSSGTVLVRDIRVGTSNSSPRNFTALGNSALFVADDGIVASELWISDGSTSGTVLLKDIYSGRSLTILSSLVRTNNGIVYFVGDDGVAGPELWASDGTLPGTYMVRDINPGASGASIANLTAIGDIVYFSATTAASGAEPWRSNGTSGGTFMLADLGTTTTSSSPSSFVENSGLVYFI